MAQWVKPLTVGYIPCLADGLMALAGQGLSPSHEGSLSAWVGIVGMLLD